MTGKSLLIVEDDLDYQDLFRRALPEHELIVCASFEEAAAWIGRKPFDVIVSDFKLLGRAGLEALGEMRRRGAATAAPIFLCSSADDPVVRQSAMDSGADGFFVKPFLTGALRIHLASGREES